MTEPDERLPTAATGEPTDQPTGGPTDEHDLEAAEEYAESVSIDPSPDEISHYLDLVGDPQTDEPAG